MTTSGFSTAGVIAVGSELLTPHRIDTNSLFVTARLNDLGIDVRIKMVVGDDRAELTETFRHVLPLVDLVVLTGGLGPTDDDVTRDAVAVALDLTLEEDEAIVERIRARFARRGLEMPDINRRQAQVPRGAVVLDNPNGTAPGLWLEHADRVVLLLPGPPRELQPMFEGVARDRIEPRVGTHRLYRRVLKVTGRTESHVEEAAQPVYSKWLANRPAITTTILAAPGQIELHLVTGGDNAGEAEARLDKAVEELVAVLRPHVYSVDGRSLEQVVGDLLRARGLRVATAESCTGGVVASRLTDVPGSSDYVDAGAVTYSNRSKVDILGVPEALIQEHGAVSEPVAIAMARGIRTRTAADVTVGITGIAGPGGGSDAKPVGTVAVAIIGPDGAVASHTWRLPGDRQQVKFQASQATLDLIRRTLTK
jgi:nicotinamide-nucleotide amidase